MDNLQTTQDPQAEYDRNEYFSFEGALQRDPATGSPINPKEEIENTSRGRLYYWGPNTAADNIVVRRNSETGNEEVLLIKRRSGEWAIPGGFYKRSEENSLQAAYRELCEETRVSQTQIEQGSFGAPRLVYEGYARDPRNTKHAWIETSAWLHVVDYVQSREWFVKGEDDAAEAAWFPLESAVEMQLYAAHNDYLQRAVAMLRSETNLRTSDMPAKDTHNPFIQDLGVLVRAGMQKIGIYGGSFDPIHKGHLQVAENVQQELGLDAILFVPAKQNPLKAHAPKAGDSDRLALLEAALVSFPTLFVTDLELKRDTSYTVDTLRELRAQIPKEFAASVELFLILGLDNVKDFPLWKMYQEIGRESQVVFSMRGNLPQNVMQEVTGEAEKLGLQKPARVLPIPTPEISSTMIRNQLKAGQDISDSVLPQAVLAAIREKGLYR